MELTGEQIIRAPRQTVWDALNDPAILARCVPGCEEIQKISDTEMHTRVALKIGPVRARFAGKILMSDVNMPSSCTLTFEGSGGAAGFAKGRSGVRLTEEGQGTRLSYSVEASVGGKLGQIGGRLIDSSAKKMADEFFAAFDSALTGGIGSAAGLTAEQVPAPAGVLPASSPVFASAAHAGPGNAVQPPAFGGSFRPELYRAFWFSFGAAFALLISHWWR
ncbi:CoxG family protein [Undibacterium sp. TJN25]|uniref:CoxG family protein n=1 Tax=Undibacterium sp. TJN25 TaxID=3413056 RepID=UPI003BF3722F